MASGRCDVAFPRRDFHSEKNGEFGRFSREDGVDRWRPHEKKRKVERDERGREVRVSARNRVDVEYGYLKASRRDASDRWMPHEKKAKISLEGNYKDKEVRVSSGNGINYATSPSQSKRVAVVEAWDDVKLRKKLENLLGKDEILVNGSEARGDDGTRVSSCSNKSVCSDGEVWQDEMEIVGPGNGFKCRWLEMDSRDDASTCENLNDEVMMLATQQAELSSPESGEIVGGSSGGSGKRSCLSVELEAQGHESAALDLSNTSMEVDDNSDEMGVAHQLEDDSKGCDDSSSHKTEISTSRNMLQECRNAFEYEKVHKISEGSYGVVYKARDKHTGDIVALKKVKFGNNTDGFPITALREINILATLQHPNVVPVKEVVVDGHDGVYVVMEYADHDLKKVLEGMRQPFSQSDVKCLMIQLLRGVKFLHDNWVIHRDLKSSNLLFNNRGELKICDFGMARHYGSPMKPYTPLVVTLWYRAPELLLGMKQYSTAIDMWSVGCIMAEMLAKEPLFMGESEIKQLDKIFSVLGTPNEAIWPGFSDLPGSKARFVKQPYNFLRKKFPAATFTGSPVLTELGFDLLSRLLTYDPDKRITAEEALNHGWFKEVPLPKSKEFMPTLPIRYRS